MRHPLRPILPLTAYVAALSVLLGACGASPEKKAPPTPTVGVVIARTEPVELTTDLSGRTEASQVAEVRPQVAGIVVERLFQEGSFVQAGQSLYQIDSRLYAASQNEARAALASAQASVEASRLKAERYRVLAAEGGVSQQDAADALAAYNQARAQVAQSRASLSTAQINMGFTRVISPISGRIGISSVTKGALVTASQAGALAKVQQLDPMYVNIKQSSNDFMALRRSVQDGTLVISSAPVQVILADGSAYPLPGKLNLADIDVDQQTGTITVRATIPNPKGELLPGLFVKARVGQGTVPNGILVPQSAVSRDPRGAASVLVANAKDVLEKRPVVADSVVGSNWLVTGGLKAGDRIVVEGLMAAKDGLKVKVVPAGTKSAPAAPAGK